MNEFKSSGPGIEKSCFSVGEKGAKTDVSFWRPNRKTFPGDPSNNTIVINKGWTGKPEHYKNLCREIVGNGMGALVISHALGNGLWDRLSRAGERRAESTIAICNYLEEEYGSYDLCGHSLGGVDSTRAIIEGDLKPGGLFLLGSAGLIRKDNLLSVAPRVFGSSKDEVKYIKEHPVRLFNFGWMSASTVVKYPALTASEGWYAATHYVGRHINNIASSGEGIAVINVMGDQDTVFPNKLVLRDTEDLNIDINKIIKGGTHNFPNNNSKELADFIVETSEDVPNIIRQRLSDFVISSTDVEVELFLRND